MKETDVPQDQAILGPWHEICYALDEGGRYVLAPSAGWDPANLANRQAWETIAAEVARAVSAVRRGVESPLSYHMAVQQMDVALLARYVKLSRWRVRRHLRPEIFRKLNPQLRERYAAVFRLAAADLDRLPEHPEIACEVLGGEAPAP